MMDDTHDQNQITLYPIEYAMSAVNHAADALAEFGFRRPGEGMFTQQVEGGFETKEIGVGRVCIELVDTIFADRDKIGPGGGTQPDFSHAGRGARP